MSGFSTIPDRRNGESKKKNMYNWSQKKKINKNRNCTFDNIICARSYCFKKKKKNIFGKTFGGAFFLFLFFFSDAREIYERFRSSAMLNIIL